MTHSLQDLEEHVMEFRILGPLEVLEDGVPVDLGAPKQRSLLAVLLLHGNEVVPTDRLIDLVWGEDPPRTAAHSIQIYISELRKKLSGDGEVIVTRRPGYKLQTGTASIDAIRFERLVGEATAAYRDGNRDTAVEAAQAALDLWNGPPLADFTYEDFAQLEIERLTELHSRAVAVIGESLVAEGRPLEAVPILRNEVDQDPLREEPRRLLMLALYTGGRQPEALREFRSFRQILVEETGLDPSPELLRLEEQILLRDASVAPAAAEPGAAEPTERNPYKGLRPFGEADAADFFGRDELIQKLIVASAAPLTVVVGPSGSGKSSAVRAGLIPALRDGARSGSHEWAIITLMPGRYPFAEFDAAMRRAFGSAVGTTDPSDDATLVQSMLRSISSESQLLLLVIDQFEELFTLTDEETRRALLRNLVSIVDEPRGRIKVVLTVRADFYDRPMLYPEFAELFTDNVVNVVPLTPSGIEAAAVGPAQRVGVGLAPDLLAQLVADMANEPGALPLFQYTLTELFDERADSAMTLDGYRRIGGIAGALSRRADAVYESLDPDELDVARAVFLRLVKPSDARYTRRPVPLLELEAVGDAALVSTVLTRFGTERLLTFDRDSRTGAATVEVSHEALLAAWDRLSAWLEEARLDLAELDSLMTRSDEWDIAGREPGYLLTGPRLTDCEAWCASTSIALPPVSAAYLAASVDARRAADRVEAERLDREARATRRARARLWGMLAAVVALVAVITFVVLAAIADRPPAIALLYGGEGDGGWNDMVLDGVERAAADFDLGFATKTSSELGVPYELAAVVETGPDLILNGMASLGAGEAGDIELAHPEINFVHPDVGYLLSPEEIKGAGNVLFPVFPVQEASFLVGVAAARTTQTGVVGFIGGTDVFIVRAFEAGFVAGVEYANQSEDVGVEVLVEYLTPWFDMGGYMVPSIAFVTASGMHARGADVIFTAAGVSGYGAQLAAAASTEETGIHRWHIGVDQDEYAMVQAGAEADPESEEAAVLPHILTSMVKRVDRSLYDALEDYHNDEWASGLRVYGLAEDGVGYATSGGFIDGLVPELEELKRLIIAGEIDVPEYPAGYEIGDFE